MREHSPHPISSCETLIGLRDFLPYFERAGDGRGDRRRAVERRVAGDEDRALADAHDVNVAPHNFYGDLCTMMNAHFAAAVPNLHIMEADIDRLPGRTSCSRTCPNTSDGHLIVPDRPGWGTEPIEQALRAHPPKGQGGLLNYGTKK